MEILISLLSLALIIIGFIFIHISQTLEDIQSALEDLLFNQYFINKE